MHLKRRLFLIVFASLGLSLIVIIVLFSLTFEFIKALESEDIANVYNIQIFSVFVSILSLVCNILIVSTLLFIVWKHFLNPLDALQAGIKKILQGNFSNKIITKGNGEIAQVSQGVNLISEKLIDAYKKWDEIVRERTAELSQKISALNEEKAKDEAILESMGDGLAVLDNTGRLTYLNTASEKVLGYKTNEVFGKDWSFLFAIRDENGEIQNDKQPPINQMLSKGEHIEYDVKGTIYLKKKNEELFPVFLLASPVVLGRTAIGGVIVFRDITKEKLVDRVKTEFVSLASHQLRTPLAAIRWHAELLNGPQLSDQNKNQVNTIYQSTLRMIELVNSLLNVSRMELGTFVIEPKPTNYASVAKSVIEELIPDVTNKKLKIIEEYAEFLPEIPADEKLVRIIFQNLLTNSVKYTKEGDTITVKVNLDSSENPKYIQIMISDTGYGIPSSQQDRIFSKLFRADNVKTLDTHGSGLGLYLIKSIVDQSGGTIHFCSQENEGTTFFIRMPISGMQSKEGSKKLE